MEKVEYYIAIVTSSLLVLSEILGWSKCSYNAITHMFYIKVKKVIDSERQKNPDIL